MAVFPIPIFRTRQTVVIGITLVKKLPDGLQEKKWTKHCMPRSISERQLFLFLAVVYKESTSNNGVGLVFW